jgi:hypothetical protein
MINPRVLPRKKKLATINEDPNHAFKEKLDDAVLMAQKSLEKAEESEEQSNRARAEANQAHNLASTAHLVSEQAKDFPTRAAVDNTYYRARSSAKQALLAQKATTKAEAKAEVARIYSNEANKALTSLEQEYTSTQLAGFRRYEM